MSNVARECDFCGTPTDAEADDLTGVVCPACRAALDADYDAIEVTDEDRAAAARAWEKVKATLDRRRKAEAMFGPENNRRVAREIRRKHGTELTPDEVGEIRDRDLAKMRASLRSKGFAVPDDDVAFMMQLRDAFATKEDAR